MQIPWVIGEEPPQFVRGRSCGQRPKEFIPQIGRAALHRLLSGASAPKIAKPPQSRRWRQTIYRGPSADSDSSARTDARRACCCSPITNLPQLALQKLPTAVTRRRVNPPSSSDVPSEVRRMSHEQSEKKNPQGSTASNPSDKPAGAAPEQDGAVESGNATPPVDQALLQGLLRKELPEARAREVYRW